MPTALVRAPVGGQITGRSKYCVSCGDGDSCFGSGNTHATCKGYSSPVDIAGTGTIRLYVNYPTVKSIVTLIGLECCCDACPDQYERTITVKLYGQPDGVYYIGAVMYGHVSNPLVTHNTTYNLTSSSKDLGSVPAGACNDCAFDCYTGPHCHMERSGGSTSAPCCCLNATQGSTTIYEWSFTCPVQPTK